MIRSYLISAFRVLKKENIYTFINVIGLSIGLASSFIIYAWVQHETTYDQFPGSDRVYRVNTFWDGSDEGGIASTYPMMKPRVLSQFPEIEQTTRVYNQGMLGRKTRIIHDEHVFVDHDFYYADENFFEVFPFKTINGDVNGLSNSSGVILTESTAKKIFGEKDPIGVRIEVGSDQEFEVVSVIEDIPSNYHFHFDLITSMQAHPWVKGAENRVWSGVVFHTYVKLKEGTSDQDLYAKISSYMDDFPNDPERVGAQYDFRLQPVQDIHLTSDLKFELSENGNIYYVYLFISVAILVLLVAIFNYINLTTARHTLRVKEVGVRKILGAGRKQLLYQFILESLLVTGVSFIFSVIIIQVADPMISSIIGTDRLGEVLFTPMVMLAAAGISLIIGIITGALPAWILSSHKPVSLFKSNLGTFSKGVTLRKLLVIAQFAVSIILSICTLIIYNQLNYIKKANLGYDKEHVVSINIGFDEVNEEYLNLKNELMKSANIIGVSSSSQLPIDIQTAENIDISSSENYGVYYVSVDPDFFEVMNIDFVAGRDQIAQIHPSDSLNNFVLSESALKLIGWDSQEALNESISIRHGNQDPGPVHGVVGDFHFHTFHHEIAPLVFEFNPQSFQYLLIRINPENTSETLDYISTVWKEVAGNIPMDFRFLDQQFDQLYKSENHSGELFSVFALIALFISLLGLFGLSSFAIERRTKEIGLRKMLGADLRSIMFLTTKDFVMLLAISFLLAIPIGYYFKELWLTDFVYKVDVKVWIFALAGIANFLFAIMTVSYHVLRISHSSLVDTLRSE